MSEIKNINVLNDYFMRYMFAKEGHERILLNLINCSKNRLQSRAF